MGNDKEEAKKEVEEKKEEADEKKEEFEGKLKLLGELAKQTYDFGLWLNILATWYSSLALPWGLAAAGAAATRTFVDGNDPKGTAKATALLVKLGLLNLVRDIVANLSRQDRADVVSEVTVSLLGEGEIGVVTKINNALIAGGYTKESADVAAVMGSQVTKGVFSGLKEAGAKMLPDSWTKDDSAGDSAVSQESDHGVGDMGIDSDKSVRVI